MKKFYRWLGRNIRKVLNEDIEVQPENVVSASKISGIASQGMNFTVYRADGGYVIEQRTYQKRNEEWNNHLHIVTDDKDLGEELAKIITFTNLRS
jgi:nitrate reductase alpha subunit